MQACLHRRRARWLRYLCHGQWATRRLPNAVARARWLACYCGRLGSKARPSGFVALGGDDDVRCVGGRGAGNSANVGDHVDLVVYVLMVEVKATEKGEVYLELHGQDMERQSVSYLRLWRFEEEDVQSGRVYVVRGLKVKMETQWDSQAWKYVPILDGSRGKRIECQLRTAVEDVTHVPSIAGFFS